jgi:hypothetical protein
VKPADGERVVCQADVPPKWIPVAAKNMRQPMNLEHIPIPSERVVL